ncbi:DUF3301 domain-containing protein [Vibrio vulnificus]|uniref:DUF3301 domain-containing protein n=1 Tax=Vibrio vulnificus TaxID=672 RepID=UPI00102BCEA2|nr:DUF3301 domain-containing protein [Vibrio vulnificus]EHH1180036.1 DUF3301 domain-containing protein [Vibrio vulnificus]EHH1187813.1 DUF3301 domain-containing protein [Vibrio vulnificus]EHU4848545.1 DUF3301 domain-containing protein [Vibrio vulnificus]EHU4934350.1 DUF3301 domain-containing protein [Vibrio vulnificus]EIA1302604.1 DUF3301 domain-containing protein [Vibrio vulnificus]
MVGDLFAILGLCFFCFLFWQQRRQSELAKAAIARKCDQLELQLISVAFGGHKLKTPEGNWRWHTVYLFEFSALGDDCYQGQLMMTGFRPLNFSLPPHRM